jgi:hypothetical protein
MKTQNKNSRTSPASGNAAGSVVGITAGGTAVGSAGSAQGSLATTQTRPPKGFRLKVQQYLAGVQSVLPAGSSLPGIGAAPMSQSDIVTELTTGLSAYGAVDAQTTALKTTRAQLQASLPALRTFCEQLKNALVAFFGSNSPELANFGITPKSTKVQTLEQKIARVALGQQTRALRGTKGPKEKAAVKARGTVTVSTAISATASAPGTAAPTSGEPATPAPAVVSGSPPGNAGA